MKLSFEPFTLTKRSPLTISRGTSASSTNLWVRLAQDGIEGWGEASPFVHWGHCQPHDRLAEAIASLVGPLAKLHPLDRQKITAILDELGIPSAARAAIDLALHDWLGKSVGLPLWRLWGFDRDSLPPVSVTIGISSPEAGRARLQAWREVIDVQLVKLKLGNPAGLAADRALFEAIQDEADGRPILVDANGGWSLDGAIEMAGWLAAREVIYLEQPLPAGCEDELKLLYEQAPLPIFADESCMQASDIPRLADRIDGVNIKLMKSGGLTEAHHLATTARACGLQVMFGCYSDSTLSNTAALHLGPLADYLDLDSHLNLVDDPFQGAIVHQGHLKLGDGPGLGVTYRDRKPH